MKHEGIGGVTRFVIMNNIFNTPYEPSEKYDLKGSVVGRTVSKKKEGAIFKDLDISRKLYLPADCYQAFIIQLDKDCQFLATHRVMDYSLLLGVYYPNEQNKKKAEENIRKRKEGGTYIPNLKQNLFQQYGNGIRTVTDEGTEEIYFIGIIDILIEYATKKKMEHMLKSIAYDSGDVSVVDPEFYRQRFYKFITSLLYEPKMIEDKRDKESSSSSISSEEDPKPEEVVSEKTKPKELEKTKSDKKTSSSVNKPKTK
jgi:1-phosphatidylinositol-4-phosphate 5-kinase